MCGVHYVLGEIEILSIILYISYVFFESIFECSPSLPSLPNNGSTVGSGVFYTVRSEAISLNRP
jgi:hypothetical protein